MRHRNTPQSFVVALLLLGLVACGGGAKTNMAQSYRNPGYEQTTFDHVLVIGVTQDQERRRAFEDALSQAIAGQGGRAAPSWQLLPQSEKLEKEQILAVVETGGFDGVLISRLLAVEQQQEYTKGSTYNEPRTRYYPASYNYGYGGYYGFYGTTYTKVHEPGYLKTSRTIVLESMLYSVATEELVWTGQSETVDAESIEDARASMTKAVASALQSEQLIP